VSRDCWNTIGVRGDRSCPELQTHIHCHNCPVFLSAAQALLDRDLTATDLAAHTAYFAKPKNEDAQHTQSVLVFRVRGEWLALPMPVVKEVADARPIHTLPHRRGGAVLGVANVRGELVTCVSIEQLLGLGSAQSTPLEAARAQARLLVIRRQGVRAVCPVDEVHGIHRVRDRELQEVPATVGRGASGHSKAVLSWQGRSVGLLDEQALFAAVQRSLT